MAARGMGSPEKYTMALAASMDCRPPRATTRSAGRPSAWRYPRAISSDRGIWSHLIKNFLAFSR